jgi:hypothetical protein
MKDLSPKHFAALIIAGAFLTIWLGQLATCFHADRESFERESIEIAKAKACATPVERPR